MIGPRCQPFSPYVLAFCRYRYRDSSCVANPVTPVSIGDSGSISPAGGSLKPVMVPPKCPQFQGPIRARHETCVELLVEGRSAGAGITRERLHLDGDAKISSFNLGPPPPSLAAASLWQTRGDLNRFRTHSPAGARRGGLKSFTYPHQSCSQPAGEIRASRGPGRNTPPAGLQRARDPPGRPCRSGCASCGHRCGR